MTAIAGMITLDGRPCAPADLRGVLDLLAPLGRDGEGAWAGRVGPMGTALGAARRRRVPEDDADTQPVVLAGGQVTVVADVVLTNRPELCRLLDLPDTLDLTDPAIVGHAYLRWGEACCERLRGDFALAVADQRRGGVLLARDHIGSRPLNVYRGRGWLGFASTALAVTGFDGVPAELDLDRAKEFLALVMISERTWIRDVAPVPRATTLWVTPDGVRSRRFWEPDIRPQRRGSAAEHAEELRAALDEAVRVRLRRRGGIGVMCSGGLDSTAVAAVAAGLVAPEPVHTYTSVPPPGWRAPAMHNDPDESPLVRLLAARHPNLSPAFVDVLGTHAIDGDPDLYAAGATPARNTLNQAWIRTIQQRAAADGVSVLMWGLAGNLTFSSDGPRWLLDLLSAGRFGEAWREARAWSGAERTSLATTAWRWVVGPLAPAWAHRRRARRLGRPYAGSWLSSTALRPELGADPELRRGLERHTGAAGYDRRSVRRRPLHHLAVRASLAECIAVWEARHGLRHADPLADVRVVEVCARQPDWARRHRGVGRAAARAAMAGSVPDEIRLRQVRGAQLPDWLDRATDAYAEISQELVAAHGHAPSRALIDLPRLDALVRDWPAPERAGEFNCLVSHGLLLPRALAISRYLRWFDEWTRHRHTPAHPVENAVTATP